MRWLTRSFITLLVMLPFLWHVSNSGVFNPDALRSSTGPLTAAENWAYDTRIRAEMPGTKDKDIVIIDIDEKSINEIGQWPWKRDVLAKIVDNLYEHYGLNVLAFDIAFPEPDRADDLELLEELEAKLRSDPSIDVDALKAARNRDAIFAKSFKDRKVILGAVFDGEERSPVGSLGEPLMANVEDDGELVFPELVSFTGNLPELQSAAWGVGNFHPVMIDADGKIRRTPLMISYQGDVFESLSFSIIRAKLGAEPEDVQYIYTDVDNPTFDTLVKVRVSGVDIPVGDLMTVLVPYRASATEGFSYVSAVDILNKTLPKDKFVASIGIVGTTAAGLKDIRVTPVSENFPGVEVHANIVSGVMTDAVKEYPAEHYVIQFVGILICAILLTIFLPRLPILFQLVFTLGLLFVIYFLNLQSWRGGVYIPIAPTFLFVTAAFIAHLVYGSFVESNRKRQLTRLFGQYVPPQLVKEMEVDLDSYTMETKDAELTVMFADIMGFTKMSETLTAEQVTEMLNTFLTVMTEVIHDKRGTIDKYMGDSIMAFWGAPLADERHAENAVEAAFAMQERVEGLNEQLNAQGLPSLELCIGINSGPMRVGNMGSEFRMTYTVMGDSVNLASRIEGLTRIYGSNIIIGESTRDQLSDILCLELDRVLVKGKDNAVSLYEPLCLADEMTPEQDELLVQSRHAIDIYREQDWEAAEAQFQDLGRQFPERTLFPVYLERIRYFRRKPPNIGWDGSYRFTNK